MKKKRALRAGAAAQGILDMVKNAHDPDFDGKTGDTPKPGEPLVIPEEAPAPPVEEPAPAQGGTQNWKQAQ